MEEYGETFLDDRGELWAGEELGLGLALPTEEGRMGVADPRVGVADEVMVVVLATLVLPEEGDLEGGIMDGGRLAGNTSLAPARAISFIACRHKEAEIKGQ